MSFPPPPPNQPPYPYPPHGYPPPNAGPFPTAPYPPPHYPPGGPPPHAAYPAPHPGFMFPPGAPPGPGFPQYYPPPGQGHAYPTYPPPHPNTQYHPHPNTFHQQGPPQSSSPPPPPTVLPPAVNSRIASDAVRRFLCLELSHAGFTGSSKPAMERLEAEVLATVNQLYQSAQQFANLSNRANPTAQDLLMALQERGASFDLAELRKIKKRKRREGAIPTKLPQLIPAPPRPESPELLHSDSDADSNDDSFCPPTLVDLPEQFPEFPPRHSYQRKPPVMPRKNQAVNDRAQLEKKLADTAMVQQSLRHLMEATEEAAESFVAVGDQDTAVTPAVPPRKLLGGIVNWQAKPGATQGRKRWKV